MSRASRLVLLFAAALFLLAAVRRAAPVHGLAGRYYLDETWSDPVVNRSLDERISFERRDLEERAGRGEHVSAVWEGCLRVLRQAEFRFTLRSDDGAWLEIDDVQVIDNGGIHGDAQFSLNVPLAAGIHRLRVRYFNAEYDGLIILSWRRTGFLRFLVPKPHFYPGPIGAGTAALDTALDAAAFFLIAFLIALGAVLAIALAARPRRIVRRASSRIRALGRRFRDRARASRPASLARAAGLMAGMVLLLFVVRAAGPVRGWSAEYYANENWVGPSILTSVDRSIHFEKEEFARRSADLGGAMSVIWEGYLHVPRQAAYRFEIVSDDGSTVELDGRPFIDNGGYHPSRRVVRSFLLARGVHPVRVRYFEAGDGGHADVFVRKMGMPLAVPLTGARVYPKPPGRGLVFLDDALSFVKAALALGALISAVFLGLGLRSAFPRFASRADLLSKPLRAAGGRVAEIVRNKGRWVLVVFVASWLLAAGAGSLRPEHGLIAKAYPGLVAEGAPAAEYPAPSVGFGEADFRGRIGGSGPVTIIYEGYLLAPKTSTYRFAVRTSESIAVALDGRAVLDVSASAGGSGAETPVPLMRGPHRIRIQLRSATGRGSLDFSWSETRTVRWLMPPLRLYPGLPGRGTVALETGLPPLIAALKGIRFVGGCLLALLALGAILPRKRVFAAVPLVIFIAAGAITQVRVIERRSTSVEGCDSYAYLQGAEIIGREGPFRTDFTDPLVPLVHAGFTVPPSPDKEIFVLAPHGHYVGDLDKGTVVNTFPPGMSMLLAPVVRVGGRGAAFWFVPLLSVLLYSGFFFLGKRAVDATFGLGLAAAAMLNPPIFENTIVVMSDVPSLAFVSLSAYFLYRNVRRPRRVWLLLAGAAFGFSLVVRYSNAAAAIPLAMMLWAGRTPGRSWRGFLRGGAFFGSAVVLTGLLPLGVYTAIQFGTPFRLVYDPVNVSRMSLANISIGTTYYADSLVRTFGPAGLLLAAAGLAAGLARKAFRRAAATGLAGAAAFFFFYAFQSIRHDRYLIPAYPFFGLLFAIGLLEAVSAVRRSRIFAVLVLSAAVAFPLARFLDSDAVGFRGADAVTAEVKGRTRSSAVVFCDQLSGPIRLYGAIPAYRFSWTDPPVLADIVKTLRANGRTVYFLLDNAVAEDRFRAVLDAVPGMAGRLVREADVRRMPFYRFAEGAERTERH